MWRYRNGSASSGLNFIIKRNNFNLQKEVFSSGSPEARRFTVYSKLSCQVWNMWNNWSIQFSSCGWTKSINTFKAKMLIFNDKNVVNLVASTTFERRRTDKSKRFEQISRAWRLRRRGNSFHTDEVRIKCNFNKAKIRYNHKVFFCVTKSLIEVFLNITEKLTSMNCFTFPMQNCSYAFCVTR